MSEGGNAPNLKVKNDLEQDVLILDGDIVINAKQNRPVTTTIIIARHTETVVDVNCIERGSCRGLPLWVVPKTSRNRYSRAVKKDTPNEITKTQMA